MTKPTDHDCPENNNVFKNLLCRYGSLFVQVSIYLVTMGIAFGMLSAGQSSMQKGIDMNLMLISQLDKKYVLIVTNEEQIKRLEAEIRNMSSEIRELREEIRRWRSR